MMIEITALAAKECVCCLDSLQLRPSVHHVLAVKKGGVKAHLRLKCDLGPKALYLLGP